MRAARTGRSAPSAKKPGLNSSTTARIPDEKATPGSELLIAAKNGSLPDAIAALRAGCDVNSADNAGRTPLHWAVMNGHMQVLSYLLKYPGVNVNASDKNGRRPVHAACAPTKTGSEPDDCGALALLIGMGKADINVKDNSGETALMWAAYYGRKEAVSYLCGLRDCDITAKNNAGKTAEELALDNNLSDAALIVRMAARATAGAPDRQRQASVASRGTSGRGSATRDVDEDTNSFLKSKTPSMSPALDGNPAESRPVSAKPVNTRPRTPPKPRLAVLSVFDPPTLHSPAIDHTVAAPAPVFAQSVMPPFPAAVSQIQAQTSSVIAADSPSRIKDLPRPRVATDAFADQPLVPPQLTTPAPATGSGYATALQRYPSPSRSLFSSSSTHSPFTGPTFHYLSSANAGTSFSISAAGSPPRQLPRSPSPQGNVLASPGRSSPPPKAVIGWQYSDCATVNSAQSLPAPPMQQPASAQARSSQHPQPSSVSSVGSNGSGGMMFLQDSWPTPTRAPGALPTTSRLSTSGGGRVVSCGLRFCCGVCTVDVTNSNLYEST